MNTTFIVFQYIAIFWSMIFCYLLSATPAKFLGLIIEATVVSMVGGEEWVGAG